MLTEKGSCTVIVTTVSSDENNLEIGYTILSHGLSLDLSEPYNPDK